MLASNAFLLMLMARDVSYATITTRINTTSYGTATLHRKSGKTSLISLLWNHSFPIKRSFLENLPTLRTFQLWSSRLLTLALWNKSGQPTVKHNTVPPHLAVPPSLINFVLALNVLFILFDTLPMLLAFRIYPPVITNVASLAGYLEASLFRGWGET